MNKIFILLVLLFILIPSFTFADELANVKYENEETKYKVIIDDKLNLFNKAETENILEVMKPITEFGNVIFLSSKNHLTTTKRYAHDYYYDRFKTQNGCVFFIDMKAREIYIYSDGDNFSTITTVKAQIITDNVYEYASKKEYYNCAQETFIQINTLLLGGKIPEPMKYISNCLLAIIIGSFITYIIILKTSSIQIMSDEDILKKAKTRFAIRNLSLKKVGSRRALQSSFGILGNQPYFDNITGKSRYSEENGTADHTKEERTASKPLRNSGYSYSIGTKSRYNSRRNSFRRSTISIYSGYNSFGHSSHLGNSVGHSASHSSGRGGGHRF